MDGALLATQGTIDRIIMEMNDVELGLQTLLGNRPISHR